MMYERLSAGRKKSPASASGYAAFLSCSSSIQGREKGCRESGFSGTEGKLIRLTH